jgi:pimeloyl-ACP methyl ester carboxylesterase
MPDGSDAVSAETSSDVRESATEVADVEISSLGGGAGSQVVVLHHSFGNPGWLPFHERLSAGCAVEAPDVPGFGKSTQPDWARDVRDLAMLIGWWLRGRDRGPVAVVGCGFGGWVAAELAVMWPEGLSHLVLVGAAGILPERGRILDQVLISHSEYVRASFHRQEAYEAVYSAELPDELLLQWDRNREMTARVAWKPHMYNRRLPHLLPLVRTPTLVVWGDDDRVVPRECGERFAALLPDARLEIVADCGHAVDMEQPEQLSRLVREHVSN